MNTRDVVWIALVVGVLLQMLITWPSDPAAWLRKLFSKDFPVTGWRNSLTFVVPFALTYVLAYFIIKHLNGSYEVVYT